MPDPVTIFVSPIVANIINTAASLIQEEFLLNKGVKKEVEKLSSNLITIGAVLKDAEQRQLDAACDTYLRVWLAKNFPLDEKAAGTQNPNYNQFKEISAKLDVIAKEKNDFHLNISSNGGRSQNLPQNTFFVVTTDVFGRDSDKESLIDQMLSYESDAEGDVSVIPIIGMEGLGKTTLSQLIFNDGRVKNHFEIRIWVCVTVDFNFSKILEKIIKFHTGMECSNLALHVLVSRFLEILAGKNFLLVLDDVWCTNYKEWKPLQNLLKRGGKGSRVLVTTLTTKTNLLGGIWEELEDIGREIVGKCNGLPLAVKAMGGLLRGNVDVNKWKQISRHGIWELEEEKNPNRPEILPALKLSYDHLPSYLK
ncbi:hypothetical protein CRYUN_Cryun08bG0050500 [Craigia yunnanensis]